MESVSLTIDQKIVQPIVEAKIKEAVALALGGSDKLVEKMLHQIVHQKVNWEGRVSQYNSENTHSWLDMTIMAAVREAINKELKIWISENTEVLKNEIIKQISTKKGVSSLADAMLAGFKGSIENYKSTITVAFSPTKDNNW